MFVLLFAYVFAGSLGGAAYREFLIGGNPRANRGV
jgi:ABC-2 type transport system permease protein